jgi:Fe-Mn family superoxide dismutase
MDQPRFYQLQKLEYEYGALAPAISEEQLRLHHTKHHQAYVNGANAILEKLDKARKENAELDQKAILKELSFHEGGLVLHNLFWENLRPYGSPGDRPSGALAAEIDMEFGSFDRFKAEFTKAANSVEGSGWAALTRCKGTGRLLLMQIEKHNNNVFPHYRLLMVLDVWEHAYYLDYKNDRGKFVENFWNIVNWKVVNARLKKLLED